MHLAAYGGFHNAESATLETPGSPSEELRGVCGAGNPSSAASGGRIFQGIRKKTTRLVNLRSRNKPLDGRCLRVGMVMANSVDAQFGVPNDVTIWLQPPNGLSNKFGTTRFEKPQNCRLMTEGVHHCWSCTATVFRGEHGGVVKMDVHQSGLLGCRVGEASNRGRVQTRQASRRMILTHVDGSSDEECLVRPNNGRHVMPRTDGELPTTVLACVCALSVAGLVPECGFPTSSIPQRNRRCATDHFGCVGRGFGVDGPYVVGMVHQTPQLPVLCRVMSEMTRRRFLGAELCW